MRQFGGGIGRSGSTTPGDCSSGVTWVTPDIWTVVKILWRQQHLWRAVDEDGDVIDILVQSRRSRAETALFGHLGWGLRPPADAVRALSARTENRALIGNLTATRARPLVTKDRDETIRAPSACYRSRTVGGLALEHVRMYVTVTANPGLNRVALVTDHDGDK